MYRSMKLIRKLMEYTECLWLTPARPAGPRRFSPSG